MPVVPATEAARPLRSSKTNQNFAVAHPLVDRNAAFDGDDTVVVLWTGAADEKNINAARLSNSMPDKLAPDAPEDRDTIKARTRPVLASLSPNDAPPRRQDAAPSMRIPSAKPHPRPFDPTTDLCSFARREPNETWLLPPLPLALMELGFKGPLPPGLFPPLEPPSTPERAAFARHVARARREELAMAEGLLFNFDEECFLEASWADRVVPAAPEPFEERAGLDRGAAHRCAARVRLEGPQEGSDGGYGENELFHFDYEAYCRERAAKFGLGGAEGTEAAPGSPSKESTLEEELEKELRALFEPEEAEMTLVDASVEALSVAPIPSEPETPTVGYSKAPSLASFEAPSLASTEAPSLASSKAPSLASTEAPNLASSEAPNSPAVFQLAALAPACAPLAARVPASPLASLLAASPARSLPELTSEDEEGLMYGLGLIVEDSEGELELAMEELFSATVSSSMSASLESCPLQRIAEDREEDSAGCEARGDLETSFAAEASSSPVASRASSFPRASSPAYDGSSPCASLRSLSPSPPTTAPLGSLKPSPPRLRLPPPLVTRPAPPKGYRQLPPLPPGHRRRRSLGASALVGTARGCVHLAFGAAELPDRFILGALRILGC